MTNKHFLDIALLTEIKGLFLSVGKLINVENSTISE